MTVRLTAIQVWVTLCLLTLLSLVLGSVAVNDHQQRPLVYAGGVILVAFVKVRFVLVHFMEARTAPRALRIVCDCWLIVAYLAIVGLYSVGFWT